MNLTYMKKIFTNYIEKFVTLNDSEHMEYYKWHICQEFRGLMDDALNSNIEEFADKLMKAKKCSRNIIDSFTTPFYGLVQIARKGSNASEAIRQMFIDLYTASGETVDIEEKCIAQFIDKSNSLLKEYKFDGFMYKQNAHSVSSYLFLYDPEKHFMYKATECKAMADYIEFYDDWGTGDNIKLKVFHRMCHEILNEIKQCPELLSTNASRYKDAEILSNGELHPDKKLHILLFDIIYCAAEYNLFDGIPFEKITMKEKKLNLEKQKKAMEMFSLYKDAENQMHLLNEAYDYFVHAINEGDIFSHKKFGLCEMISIDNKYITFKIVATGEEKKLGLAVVIVNDLISYNVSDFYEKRQLYLEILKKHDNVPHAYEHAKNALEPYRDYIADDL